MPIVASCCPAFREMIGPCGLVAEDPSAEALAEQMGNALSDKFNQACDKVTNASCASPQPTN